MQKENLNYAMSTCFLETENVTSCPICNETKAEFVLAQPDNYIPMLYLHRCCACQSIYLNPRLTLTSIATVEDQSEVYIYSPEVIEEKINGDLTGIIRWLETYKRTQHRQLLDIGCNRGLLMEAARRQGWQVTGLEISTESVNRARADFGLTIYTEMAEINLDQQFDLITAWHVLEHTLDPVIFLQQAVARLRPGGILAIQVPSFDYLDEFRKRQQFSNLVCAVHNFYFTVTNLRMLLEKFGVHIVQLANDPEALLLTAIVVKPLTMADRLSKARRLIQSGEWHTLVQEIHSYWRWKLTNPV